MPRLAALMFAAFVLLTAGCGGGDDEGDDLLTEDSLRECLAEDGLTATRPAGPSDPLVYAPLSGAVPDFVLYGEEGTSVGVSLHGNEEKAERAVADLNGAFQSVGGADRREVLSEANAVVIFGDTPSEQTRRAVEGCLG